MTKEQLQEMSFEAQMEWALANIDDVTTEETLKQYTIYNIESDNLHIAIHVLKSLWNNPSDYYRYDYSMGTLETPTPITELADIEDLI